MCSSDLTTRGLGLACAVGVLIAATFALLVLPAALVVFGRWVFWPKVPHVGDTVLVDSNSLWHRVGEAVSIEPNFSHDRDANHCVRHPTLRVRVGDRPFDGGGRIVLPEDFMAQAKLTDKGAFVGKGRSFQIWEPGALADAQAAMMRRIIDRRRTEREGSGS